MYTVITVKSTCKLASYPQVEQMCHVLHRLANRMKSHTFTHTFSHTHTPLLSPVLFMPT